MKPVIFTEKEFLLGRAKRFFKRVLFGPLDHPAKGRPSLGLLSLEQAVKLNAHTGECVYAFYDATHNVYLFSDTDRGEMAFLEELGFTKTSLTPEDHIQSGGTCLYSFVEKLQPGAAQITTYVELRAILQQGYSLY